MSIKQQLKEEALNINQLFSVVNVTDNEGNETNLQKAISTDLSKMLKLVQKNSDKGEIVLKLKFQKGNDKKVKIVGNLVSKFPVVKDLQTHLYAEDGLLFLEDPGQLKLDLGSNNVRAIN